MYSADFYSCLAQSAVQLSEVQSPAGHDRTLLLKTHNREYRQ